MSKVGNSTGAPAPSTATAVAEPETKTAESSKTEAKPSLAAPPTTTAGADAAEKKAEHTLLGNQIAADLKKKINPNAPPLEYIDKGGAVARQGQTGESVTEIQRALNREGTKPELDPSGKFDAKTEAAVKEFQRKHKLPDDGSVGPDTLKKLLPTADTVEKHPQIAKLLPAVQKDIADSMRKTGPNDYDVRARIMDVAAAPGFDKLAPERQREMLGILAKGPKDMGLADGLRKVAGSENFQKLDPSIQAHGLAQLSNHSGDAVARDTLINLQTTNGFQKLDKHEQERLLTLVGGKNELISKPAREALEEKMKGWKADGNAEDQGKELKTFLKEQKWPDWQTPNDAWNGRTTSPDSVKGPESVATGPFRLKGGPADKYSVKYGSKEIPLFVPAGTPRADVDKLIGTMNALPTANRQLIDKIVLESENNSKTSALFDAGGGVVTAYPDGLALEPPSRRMSAMVHESAHLIDAHLQKKNGPQWDKDWKKAMGDDKLVASQYGKKSDGEDFAEVYLLYKLSKGKPEFDEYRRMYPNRFKLIDDIEQKAHDGTL